MKTYIFESCVGWGPEGTLCKLECLHIFQIWSREGGIAHLALWLEKNDDMDRNVKGGNWITGDTPCMKWNSDAATMFVNRVADVPLTLSKRNHIWVYIYDEYKYKTSIFGILYRVDRGEIRRKTYRLDPRASSLNWTMNLCLQLFAAKLPSHFFFLFVCCTENTSFSQVVWKTEVLSITSPSETI